MDTTKPHRISVKNLIDICLKQGDLSSGYVSRSRALDGIREHTRQQGMRPDNYQKEVPVSITIEKPFITLEIFGRIDGVLESDKETMIEEIKTCLVPAGEKAQNPSPMHLAQLKCYGHMLVQQKDLDSVILQLTYVRIGSQTTAEVKKTTLPKNWPCFSIILRADILKHLKISRLGKRCGTVLLIT